MDLWLLEVRRPFMDFIKGIEELINKFERKGSVCVCSENIWLL